ncbi:probable G-protein coupled receptor 139 [Heterodontus francisci]|uniref:probable G-protein coupled receptor 139 n=1 Tax=Heterodontus francisci TaxID=7792 RepID=UPI00355AE19C
MIISNKRESNRLTLTFSNITIDESLTINILGVTVDQKRNWSSNINILATKEGINKGLDGSCFVGLSIRAITSCTSTISFTEMDRPILAQIENVYYPILAVVGVPANLFTVVILSHGKCGLSKCINYYLLAMAATDLLVLIFDVILFEIKEILNFTLAVAAIDCSVWLTVAFTFERLIAICYQKLKAKYCTTKTAVVVVAVVCGLTLLQNIPIYFAQEHVEIIDNIHWFCVAKPTFYILPIWKAYFLFHNISTPLIPFMLIVLLNALTIRHILQANRVRKDLRRSKNYGNHNDPEMGNRRKSIILLLAISGSFILLWMVNILYEICVMIIDTELFQTDYTNSFTIMEHIGYMLQRLSSCTNAFIYAVAQTKFRDALMKMIKYPYTQIIKLIKLN